MALRQYVGARYVPKFSDVNGGVWDNSYTYEPLTIVKHGNDYYTSNKEVPTGVAITNTEYWVLTGNYNGAISELHDEIGVISSSILSIGGQVEDISGQIETIDGQIDDLEDAIEAITPMVEKEDLVLLTDSYGTVDDNFLTYLDDLGINDLYEHIATKATAGHGGFYTGQWSTDIASISVTDATKVSTILLVGGTNDAKQNMSSASTTIATNIATFINAAKTRFANLKQIIYLYMPHVNIPNYTGVDLALCYRTTSQAFTDPDINMVFVNAIGVFNPWTEVTSDKMHPTAEGSVKIANAVISVLKGREVNKPGYRYNKALYHGDTAVGICYMDLTGDLFNVRISYNGSFDEQSVGFRPSGFSFPMYARQNSDSTVKLVSIESNSDLISAIGSYGPSSGQIYFNAQIPSYGVGFI